MRLMLWSGLTRSFLTRTRSRAKEKAWKLILKGAVCGIVFWVIYEALSSVRMIYGI